MLNNEVLSNREVMELRARQIFQISEHALLNGDPTDFTIGTAYKYAYLIVRRSPKAFFEAFREGDLRISPDEVAEFIWQYADNIEGPNKLLSEERLTIEHHNEQVSKLNRTFIKPNVIALTHRSTNIYG